MSVTLDLADLAARAQRERPAFNVPSYPGLMQYASNFTTAAAGSAHVDPCMLAAIVQRESGGHNVLQYGVDPGPGCGVGLCQITYAVDWSNPGNPMYPGFGSLLDVDVNLRVAVTAFLDPLIGRFPGSHIAAFAAYNAGAQAVAGCLQAGRSPDTATTGGNYGTDVFNLWMSFLASSLGVKVGASQSSGGPSIGMSHPVAPPPRQMNNSTSIDSDLSDN